MSEESVKNYFLDKGMPYPIIVLSQSSATVDLAAEALGVEPALIAKTLAFHLKDRNILVVTKGDARIDNRKYKNFFNIKAKMINYDEVSTITGHPVGGVCPFGLKGDIDVYLDLSLKSFEYVYPAAGSVNTALKISPTEIENLTEGEWIDVCC